jgi:hypothetical protein
LKEKIPFISSSHPANPNNILAEMPLVVIRSMDVDAIYLPSCSTGGGPFPPRQMPFGEWWEEPIFSDRQKTPLSRQALVLTLRNQEGGAHYDDEIKDTIFRALAYDNAAG